MIPSKSKSPGNADASSARCRQGQTRERRVRTPAAPSQGHVARSGRRPLLISALLAIALIALYAPVTGYDFITIDDAEYVVNNQHINHGLSWMGIKWAFTHSVAGNWHPLTVLSHELDCQFFSLSPGAHHLTNVLLHLANTLLLFWVLLHLTDEERKTAKSPPPRKSPPPPHRPSNLWPCALVAALFAFHPLHVESVAWISERKDLLSAFFFFLTLWAYSQYVRRAEGRGTETEHTPHSTLHAPRSATSRWYVLALVLFALGLMSKSMLVTLPFVLLLLDYWPLQRLQLKTQNSRLKTLLHLLLEKTPFFVLAAICSVITFVAQNRAGAVVSLEHFPLEPRVANALVSYARYLGKTLWPASLALPYPQHLWEAWQIQGASVLFAGLSLVALCTVRRRPYLFVGWFFFAGMLVPVIGLVQVGLQAMADHFTYLPLIGIFVALAWVLTDAAVSAARRRLLAVGGAALVAVFMTAAAVQIRYWKDSETLFTHALRVTSHNAQAHYLLGAILDSQGKPDLALWHFTEALQDNPAHVKARCGLAYILYGQGKFEEAARQYQAALRFEPDSPKAHFGLAETLLKQGKPDEAIAHYFSALRSKPDIAEAHYQLAGLLSAKHQPAAAISHLFQAVRLAPDWDLALNNLAWMLATESDAKLRNGPEAARLALRAVSLTGRNNPSTLDTLGAAYAEAGRFPDAIQTAQWAIQKANASGQTNLAVEIAARLELYQSQRAYRE